jgi:hypothetical protein
MYAYIDVPGLDRGVDGRAQAGVALLQVEALDGLDYMRMMVQSIRLDRNIDVIYNVYNHLVEEEAYHLELPRVGGHHLFVCCVHVHAG